MPGLDWQYQYRAIQPLIAVSIFFDGFMMRMRIGIHS